MKEEAPASEVSLSPRLDGPPSLRCPYCHEDLAPDAHPACAVCRAPRHTECAQEAGACASCGAGLRSGEGLGAPSPTPEGAELGGPASDPRSRALLEGALLPGEPLLWAGRSARWLAWPRGPSALALGLLAGVSSLVLLGPSGRRDATGSAEVAPWVLLAWLGFAFLVWRALSVLGGRHRVPWAREHYGITDRRVIRASSHGGAPQSVYLSSLGVPSLRPGSARRRTISLGLPPDFDRMQRGQGWIQRAAFRELEDVDQAEQVFEVLARALDRACPERRRLFG